ALVEGAREHLDLAIEVVRSEHGVEIHLVVEETPGDITHHGPQKRIRGHVVGHRSVFGRPAYIDEILVTAERKTAELERAIARTVAGVGRVNRGGGGHLLSSRQT